MHRGRAYTLPLRAKAGQKPVEDVVDGKVVIDMTKHDKPDTGINARIERIHKVYCTDKSPAPAWPFENYIHLINGTWFGYKSPCGFNVAAIDEIPCA